jgi:hypothetical protein
LKLRSEKEVTTRRKDLKKDSVLEICGNYNIFLKRL